MSRRPAFAAIVDGWMLVDDNKDLARRLAQLGPWACLNAPLSDDEEATMQLMADCLIARVLGRAPVDWPSITCPVCAVTSYHPKDISEGYCAKCHDWTTPR